MIIVADSGGSKIDWRFMRKEGSTQQFHSLGFNPYYQPIEHLRNIISTFAEKLVHEEVTKVFYYGTGVSSDQNINMISKVFSNFFPAAKIEVSWDLLAAARALCGRDPGIACILGTGSNSCLYDGENIVDNVANLGWILADEGSGTYLGKKLIFDYFRKQMSSNLAQQFHERFPLSREEVLDNVYRQEKPGAFLASFSKFILENINESYYYQLAYNAFADFIDNNVRKYQEYERLPVHFTGSISFHFKEVLIQVCQDKKIIIKNIQEGPISGLTKFHQKDL